MPKEPTSSRTTQGNKKRGPYDQKTIDYWMSIFSRTKQTEGSAEFGYFDKEFYEELRSSHAVDLTASPLARAQPTITREPTLLILEEDRAAGSKGALPEPVTWSDVPILREALSRTSSTSSQSSTSPTGIIASSSSAAASAENVAGPSSVAADVPRPIVAAIITSVPLTPDSPLRHFLENLAKASPELFKRDAKGNMTSVSISQVLRRLEQRVMRNEAEKPQTIAILPNAKITRSITVDHDKNDTYTDYTILSQLYPGPSLDYYASASRKHVPQLAYPDTSSSIVRFNLRCGLRGIRLRDIVMNDTPGPLEEAGQLMKPMLGIDIMQLEIVWPGYKTETCFIDIRDDTTRETLATDIALQITEWYFYVSRNERVAREHKTWDLGFKRGRRPCLWQNIFLNGIRALEKTGPRQTWITEFDFSQ
ncbi:hypothetical protein BXZ70DRAFT_183764 [Cristinia sonorae]|uniref:Uncharacterized protein n=1 Tax=Cristinia sonorae TaxID=1940300 RepID=A0A8K0XQ77_9AGAR|nr:hypothetical protein BXZ70DRAFT_183764 [Cristinia sonorae]